MFSKSANPSIHEELQRAKHDLARLHRRTQLLENRLRNNQKVFVDFESIAKSVGHLIASRNSEDAVREALALIGEGSGLDRIYILKNSNGGTQGGVIDQIHTWISSTDKVVEPDFQSLPFEVFFPAWMPKFKSGKPVFGSLESAPDIELLTLSKQGVKSYLWIPIFVENQWWGVMGLDQIAESRKWHPKEISGYSLLATSIMEFMRRQKLEQELRVFQNRYEMASQAGQVGVWDWGIEDNRIFLDGTIKAMAGYSNTDTFDSLEDWESVFVMDQKAKWVDELNSRIARKDKEFELDHYLKHTNGHKLDAYTRGKVVYNQDGKAIRVLGTTTDITHLKSIQNDLRKARDLAEEGSRSKSEFMAKMSHEIRTPLNGIIGFATLLKHTDLDSEQGDYLNKLDTSSRLLLSMVNNILDFSKIEAGKLDLERRPFDIQGSVQTIIQVFGDALIKKGVKMKFNPAANLPVGVITDPLRIQQVILNLVGNAVKFTESGNIEVLATWDELKDHQGRFGIAVKDTGIGIGSDRLTAIFEPFTQADSSMTRRFGGSGLGLSICQSILQAMGSQLEVTSEEGVGSKFSFEILVEKAPEEAVVEMERLRGSVKESKTTQLSSGKLEQRAKARILLAEDNSLNQQVISKLLNRLGYNAVLVEDGKEAVDALNRWEFDLVFMDLMMPEMDGITATRIIRESLPPAKQPIIIALTANSSEDDINNCLAVGMNDFLSKPVELEVLEKTLIEHLDLNEEEASAVNQNNTINFSKIQAAEDGVDGEDESSYEHFDPEFMRKLMGSSSEPDVVDEFCIDGIEIFLETTGELIEALAESSRGGSWKEFERAAHSLKGTAKTVGALILGNQALQLELWVQEGHPGSRDGDIEQVAMEYQMLIKELSRYRETLKKNQRQIF
jgi:signal transduction histidine kinase/DNA-binding NarL/FixJ family response regulator/HPt (histidine-containing phosphotransfer) domain-containing protein